MMTAEKFVENVRSYIGRPYSEIDCAMLLHLASDGVIRRGSNSQWRYEIGVHGRISDGRPTDPYPAGNDLKSTQLEIGMAVFMHKSKDTDKYPDGQGDYSHVGVVTSVQPLRITNVSYEEGCVTDYMKIGTFCAWGYLKKIDYGHNEQEGTNMYKVKITTKSLRIRAEASTGSAVLGSLPRGTEVECSELKDGWYKLAHADGWISADYCVVLNEPSFYEDDPVDDPAEPVHDWAQEIAELRQMILTNAAAIGELSRKINLTEGDDE